MKIFQFFKKFISIGGLLPTLTATAGQKAMQSIHNSATEVVNDSYRNNINTIFLRNIQLKAQDKAYYKYYLRERYFLIYFVYFVRFIYSLTDLIVGVGRLHGYKCSIKLSHLGGDENCAKSLFIFTNNKLREQLPFYPSNYQVLDIVISMASGNKFLIDDYVHLIKLKIRNFSVGFDILQKVYVIEKYLGSLISDHRHNEEDCALLLREGCGPYQMAISRCFRETGIKSICYFPSSHIPEHTIFPPVDYFLTTTEVPMSKLFYDQKLYILEEDLFSNHLSIQAQSELDLKSVCYLPAWGEINNQWKVDSAVIGELERIFDVVHFRPHPQEFDDRNRVRYFDALLQSYTHTVLSNSKLVPFSDILKDVSGCITKVYSTCIVDALMSGRFVIFIGPHDSLIGSIPPQLNDKIIYVRDDMDISDDILQRVKHWGMTRTELIQPAVSSLRTDQDKFQSILNEILAT